jgi:hypothetical protein
MRPIFRQQHNPVVKGSRRFLPALSARPESGAACTGGLHVRPIGDYWADPFAALIAGSSARTRIAVSMGQT